MGFGECRPVPNPAARARVYQERAAECLELARLAATEVVRHEYELLAAGYLKLGEAELRLADEIAANNLKEVS